ncbi:hypothetical protein M407DRAFT_20885 [Tulasnella calospora MUT 4182]|uniref:Uncharacterized protein n=1 Tax=Tulasnella calospora MUT 4182 TaxID=1051891 RepID=A0A0C3QP77_9AGAM|nr:hypothetical protein M407DRAFT_20885 [Tulasnella calospora MUT 4182]
MSSTITYRPQTSLSSGFSNPDSLTQSTALGPSSGVHALQALCSMLRSSTWAQLLVVLHPFYWPQDFARLPRSPDLIDGPNATPG